MDARIYALTRVIEKMLLGESVEFQENADGSKHLHLESLQLEYLEVKRGAVQCYEEAKSAKPEASILATTNLPDYEERVFGGDFKG